jgi:hypothetical protein
MAVAESPRPTGGKTVKNLTEESYIFDTPKGFVALDARDGAAIKALLDQIRDTSADLYTTIEENARLYVEVEHLRAEWESVPWGAIKHMLGDIVCAERENLNSTMDDFSDVLNWWIANAPEAAKE